MKLKYWLKPPARGEGDGARHPLELTADRLRLGALVVGLIVTPLLFWKNFGSPLTSPLWLLLAVSMFAWLLLSFGSQALDWIGNNRARDQLAAANGLLCLHCRFNLTKHDEEGKCPECGERYTHSELRPEWMRTYPGLDFNLSPSTSPSHDQ